MQLKYMLYAMVVVACAFSEVTIASFSPENGSTMKDVQFPIVFTFSENVQKGVDGKVVIRNSFNDTEEVAVNSPQFVLDSRNLTITSKDKFYYGSTYSVFFSGSPVVDMNNVTVVLAEGTYSFSISKKDNSPMFIGIGVGMGVMLVIIFGAYFILKCLVKRKEARESKLPETTADTK